MRLDFSKKTCVALCLFFAALWSSELYAKQVDLSAWNDVAIQDHGRKKPFYVFATEHLRTIYGKESWRDENGEIWPAVNVLLDGWMHPDRMMNRPYWLVENLSLKQYLGLPEKEKYFSYATLSTNQKLSALVEEGVEASAHGKKLTTLQVEAQELNKRFDFMREVLGNRAFCFIPNSQEKSGKWQTLAGINLLHPSEDKQEITQTLVAFVLAYESYVENGDAKQIVPTSLAVKKALRDMSPEFYPSERLLKLEVFYAKAHLFSWAWKAYLLSAIVLLLTAQLWRRAGYVLGLGLALLGFVLQVSGFVLRVIISDRAPVTNMYETVIWLGFGAVLLALVFELIYRSRYFLLAATPVAFVSLLLAEMQNQILDASIHPLAPVLRSNFWLSTHVLTISSSYAAFALALGIGHIVLGKLLFNKKVSASLYQYLYRALQVGVLLIGVGTILGGVWANYSWGRFWDWDPKETWALITFLCYLVVLHGRIAGWWSGVGLAAGSVLCFLSVLMAWYGVNFVLGTGLHSYGFGTGGFIYVLGFVMVELIFVSCALLVHRRSRSHE